MGNYISSIKIAKIFSTIFIPPTFTLILLTYFAIKLENSELKEIIVIATAFTFGFLFNIIYFLKLRKSGKVSDNEASIKEERDSSYLAGVLFYTIGLIILIISGINNITVSYWFSLIPNSIIIYFINKKWKISAHMLWGAGALAALTFVIGTYVLIFSPLIIFIGWCRLKLKLHTIAQVIAGALLGYFLTIAEMYLIINYFWN